MLAGSGGRRCGRIVDARQPERTFAGTSSFSSGVGRIGRRRLAMRRRPICCGGGGFVVGTNAIIQMVVFVGVLLALAWPLGAYMARVYQGRPLFGLDRLLGP